MTRSIYFRTTMTLLATTILTCGHVQAGDLLIWSPVKTAPRAYQATVGFRVPMEWEASAGADLGLGGLPGGKIENGSQLATLWGKLADDRNTFDGSVSRQVALRVDPLRSDSTLVLSRSRNWIYSEDIDLGMSHSLNINYAANGNEAASLNASQALTMTSPWTGTVVSASGTFTDVRGAFTSSLAFDQSIAPNLSFNASLTDPMSSSKSSDFRLNYQVKW
ncbi:hypothetical protein [Rhizobium sp. BK376]|jgi:hypothetical protein|uniref:hypothetical protein n=1 Tax=Rhizobium sp. BK376 TaxID=2512149 RepID=UPI00104A6504|nr:hypothetical protein [Rhizobium sp. BK376]TCR89924.1 hypothetical protein EV561_104147 [Rhizobium sp. BK376]